MEELDEVDVRRVRAEVLLEQPVDRRLEDERVVDGDEADALVAVPARLAAARDARVHDVVRHEEERLQLAGPSAAAAATAQRGTHELDAPAQHGRLEVLVLGQRAALEDLDAVHDGQPAVELPARDVVVQVLRVVCERSRRGRRGQQPTLMYHSVASCGMPCALKYSTSSSRMTSKTWSNLARFSAFEDMIV